MTVLVVLLQLALSAAEARAADPQAECALVAEESGTCLLYEVSLLRLLARPELYQGKKVRVKGFVRLEFEGQSISLSRDDDEYFITRNALWLQPRKGATFSKSLSERFCSVVGTFSRNERGSVWGGSLVDVERITLLDRRSDFKGRQAHDWFTADSFDAISREARRCKRMLDDLVRTIGREPQHEPESEGDT